ncbi:hypothetical protein BKA70DRAFT_1555628 [Coprinopsis sp. MPI-PUGE-AT-0042]|nr:hypothetical protein BKA70DRAFT_1555628 [Coprinopsis sp. MPI-PUGE-AT-0042]
MDAPSTSADVGPAKRQLPSRNRRPTAATVGGDVDITILEASKVKDFDGILEPSQRFLGTTNADLGKSSEDRSHVVNTVQTDGYFTRPESIRSYREQIIIQTPEVIDLSEAPSASTRTRVKASIEQTPIDSYTADAAYERRHRKYDAFEKRIKAREKEKLQHEHYKLKERIEQLRAIDGSAFLSLPASYFPPIPGQAPEGDYTSVPGASLNGATALNEGERRRDEMLKTALSLDDRYRQLLPPERVPKKAPKVSEPIHFSEPELPPESLSIRTKFSRSTAPARSPSTIPSAGPSISSKKSRLGPKEPPVKPRKQQRQQPIIPSSPPPGPPPPVVHPTHGDTILVDAMHEDQRAMDVDRTSNMRTAIPSSPSRQPFFPSPMLVGPGVHTARQSSSDPMPPPTSPPHPRLSPPVRVITNVTVHDSELPFEQMKEEEDSISATRPRKKSRTSMTPVPPKQFARAHSLPTIEAFPGTPPLDAASPATSSVAPAMTTTTTTASSRRTRPKTSTKSKGTCLLVQAASHVVRNRGKHRARDAFGAKLPSFFLEEYEYELPAYVLDLKEDPQRVIGSPSMTGQEADGWGESDEEVDQLDEDTMRAVEEQRLAIIHCLPHPSTSKGPMENEDSMELDRQIAAGVLSGLAKSVRTHEDIAVDDSQDENRMQE